ncbi:hypothetical protein BJ138DRAFT_1103769 [Hygrophoropsis aurantiaca]|uniref:Uncharacterized protein n=1 Tax=Hygrophoropsis aurantiaca TaxID=72124 RepID=A0ACB8A510_9AGAM|nr:hypothetical protein BJ138DRAFT_1103769 [Hygrophoropsis aurantiaca]
MKAPREALTLKVCQDANAPYRLAMKIGKDVQPIHRTCFPLQNPLRRADNDAGADPRDPYLSTANVSPSATYPSKTSAVISLPDILRLTQLWLRDEFTPNTEVYGPFAPNAGDLPLSVNPIISEPETLPMTPHTPIEDSPPTQPLRAQVHTFSASATSPLLLSRVQAAYHAVRQALALPLQVLAHPLQFLAVRDALTPLLLDLASLKPSPVQSPAQSRVSSPGYVIPIADPVKRERKIRNENIFMFWYVSTGPARISNPPTVYGVKFTDLFIHLYGETDKQAWMWNKSGQWEVIEQGAWHPVLTGRRLWFHSRDEPNWITRKTARTYTGRHK